MFKYLNLKSFPIFLMISLSVLSISCSKDEDPCSKASNKDSAECSTLINDIDDRPLTLSVDFKDSFFYDQNTQNWSTISKENLNGGVLGLTVPIYSNFLNISTASALTKISIAEDQKNRPAVYPKSDYSHIPYIELEYESGVDYIYSYVKKDLNNNIVYEKTGTVPIYQERAILPLINQSFDNQFYSSLTQIGSRFIHSITIAAQSNNKRGTLSRTIDFETTLQIPNTNFYIEYADDVKNFTLPNRWNYYFKGQDFVPNDQFKFMTLKEIKDISEQIPLDIRVVFKEPPKLSLSQEVFFEMPLDLDALKTIGRVTPQRGFSFYTLKSTFDSDKDFRMKIRMNNQFVTLSSQREFQVLNLPAGTPWDMEFFYDFTQNALYNNQGDGKSLLTPLRPVCQNMSNTVFAPLQERQDKNTAIASGGYIAHCHPQTNGKVIIPQDQITTTPLELSDTYYDFFSYYPYDQYKKDLGHFFGVKSVTFSAEGCVRVYVRQPNTSNWELKSQGSAACEEEGSSGPGSGWVYYYAERQITIFDYMNSYDGVAGLKSLMQFFGSRPLRQTPYFYFNRDLNSTKHVY